MPFFAALRHILSQCVQLYQKQQFSNISRKYETKSDNYGYCAWSVTVWSHCLPDQNNQFDVFNTLIFDSNTLNQLFVIVDKGNFPAVALYISLFTLA